MIDEAVAGELERLADAWSAAYSAVDATNRELAGVDARRAVLEDRLSAEEAERDRVADELEAIVAEIEDSDENRARIEAIIASRMSGPLMSEVLR